MSLNLKILLYIRNWLVYACIIQLFLTFISLPILIAWGLPLSLLTIVGNIVMAPFLSIFLFCASCIFFTELFYIPNQWLIQICEYISSIWIDILSYHPHYCLYGFKTPPLLVLIILEFLFLIIYLYYIRFILPFNRLLILLGILIGLMTINTFWYKNQPGIYQIPCNQGTVTLITDQGKTLLIDLGYIARSAAAHSWVEYTLVPAIIKNTGSLHLDYLIILKPSLRLFEALMKLFPTVSINTVIMPHITSSKLVEHHHYQSFIQYLKKINGSIVHNIQEPISLSNQCICNIKNYHKKSYLNSSQPLVLINYYDQVINIEGSKNLK